MPAVCRSWKTTGPVSYTHLDVYKRQHALRWLIEKIKRHVAACLFYCRYLIQNRLDTAHTRAAALFLFDLEVPQLRRIPRVRPAADFLGISGDRIYLDELAVFGIKHAHRALLLGLVHGHFLFDNVNARGDRLVDVFFQFIKLFALYLTVKRCV